MIFQSGETLCVCVLRFRFRLVSINASIKLTLDSSYAPNSYYTVLQLHSRPNPHNPRPFRSHYCRNRKAGRLGNRPQGPVGSPRPQIGGHSGRIPISHATHRNGPIRRGSWPCPQEFGLWRLWVGILCVRRSAPPGGGVECSPGGGRNGQQRSA